MRAAIAACILVIYLAVSVDALFLGRTPPFRMRRHVRIHRVPPMMQMLLRAGDHPHFFYPRYHFSPAMAYRREMPVMDEEPVRMPEMNQDQEQDRRLVMNQEEEQETRMPVEQESEIKCVLENTNADKEAVFKCDTWPADESQRQNLGSLECELRSQIEMIDVDSLKATELKLIKRAGKPNELRLAKSNSLITSSHPETKQDVIVSLFYGEHDKLVGFEVKDSFCWEQIKSKSDKIRVYLDIAREY